MPNWLGDLVMATPVLADLRAHWPDVPITAMAQSNVAPLLKNNPHINEIYSFKKPSGWVHRSQPWDIISEIKKGKYDLGILLTNSFSSAWWFWWGGVENRIGYTGHNRSWLLTRAIPFPKMREKQHLVTTYKQLLEPLGIALSSTSPQLFISEEEQKEVEELLTNLKVDPTKHRIIGINPGAAYGSAKCWLPERFKELAERLLQDPNNAILFFGDTTGLPLVNEICKNLPERVINLAGRTSLRELIALIKKCKVFVTNDSGPMHIASALGVPLIALFGSTSDVTTGPYGGGTVIHKHVACSPCYLRECPIDFKCMKQITVEEVYASILKKL